VGAAIQKELRGRHGLLRSSVETAPGSGLLAKILKIIFEAAVGQEGRFGVVVARQPG
jgi:hypothetical protein